MGNVATKKNKITLTNEDLKFLVDNTQFNQKEIEEWHQRFMNDCPNGQLDKKMFVKVYKKFYSVGDPTSFCEHVFRVFDQDQNGTIDFTEFLLAISVTSQNTDLRLKLRWIFKVYDIDGNGVIEKKELSTIVNSIYQLLSDGKDSDYLKCIANEHSKEIFKKFDIDENNFISVDEFVEGCMSDQNLLKLLAPSAL